MMIGEALSADARQLLEDMPVLQEWQSVRHPSNRARDAMLKLGTFWGVPHNAAGMNRSPSEVAQALEEEMLKRAQQMLMGSGGINATPSESNLSEASTRGSTPLMRVRPDAVSELAE